MNIMSFILFILVFGGLAMLYIRRPETLLLIYPIGFITLCICYTNEAAAHRDAAMSAAIAANVPAAVHQFQLGQCISKNADLSAKREAWENKVVAVQRVELVGSDKYLLSTTGWFSLNDPSDAIAVRDADSVVVDCPTEIANVPVRALAH